jgi:hypothetical protein
MNQKPAGDGRKAVRGKITANTISGEKVAIVPGNTAGADTSTETVPNSRPAKAVRLLGSAQDRLEILAQEIINARRAGLEISVKETERDSAKLIVIAVWGAWKCAKCGWLNIVEDKCQNAKCQTNTGSAKP